MSLITEEQIEGFLKDHLNIAYDWKCKFSTEPLELLNDIVLNFSINIYFHSLQVSGIPLNERKVLNEEEIIKSSLQGNGGNCIVNNGFMKILLCSIGYDAYNIRGSIGMAGSHVMTIVKFENGEKYLIDSASAQPLYEPLAMSEFPTRRKTVGVHFEFRKIEGEKYGRFMIGGGLFRKELADGASEALKIEFFDAPADLPSFWPVMEAIWKDSEKSIFCRNLLMFRHFCGNPSNFEPIEHIEKLKKNNESENNFEILFIIVMGKNILLGSESQRNVKSFEKYDEMVPIIVKYFPKINVRLLKSAICYLETVQPFEIRN